VKIFFPASKEYLDELDYYWFQVNSYRSEVRSGEILVDEEFLAQHPNILGNNERQRSLQREYSSADVGSPANRLGRFRSRRAHHPPLLDDSRSVPRVRFQDEV
jgi:hypothetical protein